MWDKMVSTPKMVTLPVLIFSVVLLKACLGLEQITAAGVDKIPCPGHCVEEDACSSTLDDSDCASGFVCCIEQDEGTTAGYAEYYTTEDGVEYSSPSEDKYDEVEDQADDQTVSYSFAEDGADEENPDYTYVFSEESDAFNLQRSGEVAVTCAGSCVPIEYSDQCEYILTEEGSCPPETTCCLSEDNLRATSHAYNYFVAEDSPSVHETEDEVVKRALPSFDDPCPGTCVHPSQTLFCEKVLSQYSCPLDSKCCIKRSTEQSSKVLKCTGQCLPVKMQGYCFPPNELILGSTTCKSGTTCCMQRSFESIAQPPYIEAMQFPDTQYEAPSEVVLGHLAVDDEGTVFRVRTDGGISPLSRISRIDHLRAKYNRLMAYPHSGGHIVIYSDSTGTLHQQFYPETTYDPESPFGRPSSSQSDKADVPESSFQKPVVRKPTQEEIGSQDLETFPGFEQTRPSKKPKLAEEETSLQDLDSLPEEGSDDIIIPDDDDEAPIVESKPSVADSETGRPTCPGTCMSFPIRFTCFRGHAIYDGFSCPGKSVCCARVADIGNHEKHLRSVSPYFKESSDLGKTVPKCGIKGGKDSKQKVHEKESLPGEWCWEVAIINVENQYMCSGALMGDSWVLTAAHCVASSMKENQAMFIRAGVTNLKSPEDNINGQTIRVVSTTMHQNFNSKNLDNNMALLKLQKPVVLGDTVCVVCLPTSGQMPSGNAKCTVTGYGFMSKEGDMPLKIKEAEVEIVDDTECMANVTEALLNPFILPDSSFCAGGQGQEDACQGDAGGPLVCEISGHHELIGLVSWTLGCARQDVPSIYVKVPAFMGWINQVVSSSPILTALN